MCSNKSKREISFLAGQFLVLRLEKIQYEEWRVEQQLIIALICTHNQESKISTRALVYVSEVVSSTDSIFLLFLERVRSREDGLWPKA